MIDVTLTQPDLFSQPVARTRDPDTSHAAGRDATKRRTEAQEAALRAFRANPSGLTDFELSDITGRIPTSIGKRRLELQRAGLVIATDERRPTPSGSSAIVWKVAE